MPRKLEPTLKTSIARTFASKPRVMVVDTVVQKAAMLYDFYIYDSPKLANAVQAYN